MEIICREAPEAFLSRDSIHANRLLNYIMFVLESVFKGNVHSYISKFSMKMQTQSESLQQFLNPIVGILANLEQGSVRFTNDMSCLDIIQLLKRADQFEITHYKNLEDKIIELNQ